MSCLVSIDRFFPQYYMQYEHAVIEIFPTMLLFIEYYFVATEELVFLSLTLFLFV